jgi:hypothetical protein
MGRRHSTSGTVEFGSRFSPTHTQDRAVMSRIWVGLFLLIGLVAPPAVWGDIIPGSTFEAHEEDNTGIYTSGEANPSPYLRLQQASTINPVTKAGILEFSLPSLPAGSTITEAWLNLTVQSQTGSSEHVATNIFGFAGNGVAELSDLGLPADLLFDHFGLGGPSVGERLNSLDVTEFVQSLWSSGQIFVGFTLFNVDDDHVNSQLKIRETPTLQFSYEMPPSPETDPQITSPEPASVLVWSLIGGGGAVYAWRRRRRAKRATETV